MSYIISYFIREELNKLYLNQSPTMYLNIQHLEFTHYLLGMKGFGKLHSSSSAILWPHQASNHRLSVQNIM